jgi:predicted dehydrogenase
VAARALRVALIGHEFMGRAHASAWRQVARFFDVPLQPELAVVCGRSEPRVRAAAARLGFPESSTDWREVVARPDVDLVDICTPGDSHRAIAVAAAAAGKAILCEKPLANSLAEAEEMLAAVQRAGVLHMLCHNYRRLPAVQLARHYIADGRLGRIHHFRGTYLQDWIADPAFPLVWRLQRERAGSGALGDIASHSIDLARFLVGEIAEVSGLLQTFVPERPLEGGVGRGAVTVDDAALALVRFESGAIGSIEGSRFCPGRKNHNRFEINGSRGSLAFDLERLNELEIYEEQGSDSGFRRVLATDPRHPFAGAWWPPGHGLGWEHSFTHTLADLIGALARAEPPAPDFEDGVRIHRVMDAIERSARSGAWQGV